MKDINKKMAALLMISILLISSFALFSSLIFNIDQISLKYEKSVSGEGKENIDLPATSGFTLNPEGGENPHQALFYIMDSSPRRYLKTVSLTNYDGETWRLTQRNEEIYREGYQIDIDNVKDYREEIDNEISINPVNKFGKGFIPVATYTTSIDGLDTLDYYSDENVFYSDDVFSNRYSFHTKYFRYSEDVLNNSNKIQNQKYLQLPDAISARTYGLAEDITEGYSSPFRKLVAIQEYLKNNYEYDADYQRSPGDHESTDWFLFEEEKGVCANFNSAMSVLGRAAGLPTRMVKGYKIKNTDSWRTVHADQAHSWVELGLDCGWINFDATPGSDCNNCIFEDEENDRKENTEIELNVPEESFPEGSFQIDITLTDNTGDIIPNQDISLDIDSIYIDEEENVTEYSDTNEYNISDIGIVKQLTYTGRYEINVSFDGNEIYESSYAEEVIDIDHINFEIGTDNIFVKNNETIGKEKKIFGKVFYDGQPMKNEPIEISFIDPRNNYTYEGPFTVNSNTDGRFEYEYFIEKNTPLGEIQIQYTHLNSDDYKNQSVYFKTSAYINIDTRQSYDRFKIKGEVNDDFGNPISGQKVIIYINSTETGRVRKSYEKYTEDDGNFKKVIKNPSNDYFKEDLKIEIILEESDSYIRATETKNIELKQMNKGPIKFIGDKLDDMLTQYWYILLVVVFGSAFAIGIKSVINNNNSTMIDKTQGKTKEEPIEIKISQINEKLPYVWIVNEKIDIIIELKNYKKFDRLKIKIDGGVVKNTVPDKKSFMISHKFMNKGIFKVEAVLSNKEVIEKKINLEIVDHKKGIQLMYSDLIERLKEKGFNIKEEDTPSTIKQLLIDQLGYNECISEIKRYIEKAKYSYHDLDRDDFKQMMKYLNRLGEILES